MADRSSIFDMIGPVMIGPSSSHTAGVVRIARIAIQLLGRIPEEVEVTFYNSFARTYEGHGSDKAIIAGVLNFETDDQRIKNSFDFAEKAGLKYSFQSVGNASTLHPNTIKLGLKNGKRNFEVIGISKGGGLVEIISVDGFNAHFSGQLHTLIIFAKDRAGSVSFVSSVLANEECNIATMSVSRTGKDHIACLMIEADSKIRDLSLEYLKSLHWIQKVIYIPVMS